MAGGSTAVKAAGYCGTVGEASECVKLQPALPSPCLLQQCLSTRCRNTSFTAVLKLQQRALGNVWSPWMYENAAKFLRDDEDHFRFIGTEIMDR